MIRIVWPEFPLMASWAFIEKDAVKLLPLFEHESDFHKSRTSAVSILSAHLYLPTFVLILINIHERI